MKIAFIGLGNMGTGIAQIILKSGHDLIVWNRTATKAGPLVALGARAATTAREAAAAADVVITSLMDDKSVLDVVQAGDGVLAGMRPDAVHACVTTISPECADELESLHRGYGSFYVSAPVAGRPDAAASGRLASFLGGPANAVERLMPACKSYSTSVTVISERPRMANVMKLAINYNVNFDHRADQSKLHFRRKVRIAAGASARFLSGALVRPPSAEDVCRQAAQTRLRRPRRVCDDRRSQRRAANVVDGGGSRDKARIW